MKTKLQNYDCKNNKFIEYVRDDFISSFKNDEEIRDNMRVILWIWAEQVFKTMPKKYVLDLYDKFEDEITSLRVELIDRRVWRAPRNMNDKMKRLLIAYCVDEVVKRMFVEVYM